MGAVEVEGAKEIANSALENLHVQALAQHDRKVTLLVLTEAFHMFLYLMRSSVEILCFTQSSHGHGLRLFM